MAVYRFRKEELEGALNRNALWAIVYGDMMSYLMILFLLMLSWSLSQQVQPDKKSKVEEEYIRIIRVFGGEVPEKLAASAKERDMNMLLADKLKKGVDEGEFGPDATVIVTEKRITLNLGDGVLFDLGKADLKTGAVAILETVAKTIVNRKNEIRVEGHTDTLPIRSGPYKANFELSMARAYTVIRQMEKFGIPPDRISGVGYGEYRPIADNKTGQGRAKNRRVEISLMREEQ
ncbi:flagellar motor protein MotB [Elusimicrobiota bacterium]